jgi:long-chain acyl-CoA synthetase
MLADFVISLAEVIIFLYDIISYPIYYILGYRLSKKNLCTPSPSPWLVSEGSEGISFVRETSNDNSNPIYKDIILDNKVDTVKKALDFSARKHGSKICLGTRQVLGESDESQANGKVFKKLSLGDYTWLSFDEVHSISTHFGRGLRELGQLPHTPIAIYAETRAEWIMSAFGAFSQSMYVTTLYTNLGDDAIIHGINETEVDCVITSYDLLPKFHTMLAKCPRVKTLIVMEDQIHQVDMTGYQEDVKIIQFQSVVTLGASSTVQDVPPGPQDTAIIMYTSGSTGTPKGVILAHENLITTSTSIMFLEDFRQDIYIAYLPLAHVLELLSECTMMMFGVPVGYSSPNTMTDVSTMVQKGYKGDASVLEPTMMCVVPLILERIYKNVLDKVNAKGKNFQKVFDFCYRYKLYWYHAQIPTPIIDRLIFNKIKALLGGKMRFVITGSAPLSPQTHEFLRVCLGVTLVQGYTMTETTCTGTCMDPEDNSIGRVGPPMAGVEVKLVNWEEGNYRVTDRPNPRGEICIGGAAVAKGYFKNDEKTKESFYEEGGKRWFKSGDIGEFDKKGSLRIIDRKKDLVKLQAGEYVSLGKVESQLKTHPLVENICVYADSFQFNTVAIMVPIQNALMKLAKELGKSGLDYESLCNDNDVKQAVLNALALYGKNRNLEKFEMPTRLTLSPEIWTPESGLVTAAFKLKRKCIQALFQPSIDRMYSEIV